MIVSLAHIIYYLVVTVLMLQAIIKDNVIFKSNTKVVFNDLVSNVLMDGKFAKLTN